MKKKSLSVKIGLVIIIAFFLMFLISLIWTPKPPNQMNLSMKNQPPSSIFLFGTDNFGRDIFSRIMEGTKTAFLMSFSAVSISLMLGVIIGGVSGYFGSYVDMVLMRIIDALMAFPGILFAIMLVAVFGPGLRNTIFALGIMGIPYFSRVVRSGFLQIKEHDYVKASLTKGGSFFHIAYHHILLNIKNNLIVAVTLSISSAILSEAGLSYLGLGVNPPNPSWGRMLKESQAHFIEAPWYFIFTGLTLSLLVFSFTLLGEGLRNERVKRRKS